MNTKNPEGFLGGDPEDAIHLVSHNDKENFPGKGVDNTAKGTRRDASLILDGVTKKGQLVSYD